jgi:transposase, IS5 family
VPRGRRLNHLAALCRIPLGGRVPHPTTLVKLTRRQGEQTIERLNQALLAEAAEHKLLRTHKLRVDTTVVDANVAYPTDLGLVAPGGRQAGRPGGWRRSARRPRPP